MEKLLSAEQVADFLGIHIKTFHEKLKNNEIALPYVQVTQRRRGFRPEALESFVQSQTVLLDGRGRRRKLIKTESAKYAESNEIVFLSDHAARSILIKMRQRLRIRAA